MEAVFTYTGLVDLTSNNNILHKAYQQENIVKHFVQQNKTPLMMCNSNY